MFFSSWLRNRTSNRRPSASHRPAAPRFRPCLETLEDRWLPSTLTVTSPLDDGSSGTLRATIAAAASGDTIVFANRLNGQTITLNGSELLVNRNLTIQGPGATQLAISGNHLSRVFEVLPGTIIAPQVSLSGLTIEYANSSGPIGSSDYGGDGGGIFNGGTLTLSGCNFSGNSADTYGGAIYSAAGPITASNCVFSNNSSARFGGAITAYNHPLSLSDCTFLDNTAWNGSGGAIEVATLNLTLSHCTLTGNSAHTSGVSGVGGAIATTLASTMLTDCTLSGNSAVTGGAIYSNQNQGNSLTLSGCTITGNSATSKGGGIYIFAGNASVQNTSITSNSAGAQGGGIFNEVQGTLTLYSSSVVSGNLAPDGADLYNLGHVLRKKG
jgi:predicted outer membrane repeat protein